MRPLQYKPTASGLKHGNRDLNKPSTANKQIKHRKRLVNENSPDENLFGGEFAFFGSNITLVRQANNDAEGEVNQSSLWKWKQRNETNLFAKTGEVEKVTAHNPADKEIAREKKDAKQTEAEMRANAGRAEHRAEKEEAKQSGHTHTGHHSAGNIGGGTAYTNVGTPGTYDSAPTGRTGRDYL
nr:late embryogenesis abundant protein LEA4 [Pinus tabuliformis]